MFTLNKSLAKLKASLQSLNLIEGEDTKDGNTKTNKAQKLAKPKAKRSKNKANIQENSNARRGIVMIRNFPHGFYEKQMFDYFSQFGEVTKLKIARSRKTGMPKRYGFIEFRFEDVARIAAETMNNYMMFDHIVKCTLLPKEKIEKNLFRNWNRSFVSTVKTNKLTHNKEKSSSQKFKIMCKSLKRIHKMNAILKEKGINFECVIVNRPTGLKRKTLNDKSNDHQFGQMTRHNKTSKLLKDDVSFELPKARKLTCALLTPKFMKLRAGVRISKA